MQKFSLEYAQLSNKMAELADRDGDVFLANVEPQEPVDHVLVAMEPSLGRWAKTAEDAKAKVANGFRNFVDSVDAQLVHYAVRRYLCRPGESYFVTDISKGAMLVEKAGQDRAARYDRWFPLLVEELELVGKEDCLVFALGRKVQEQLRKRSLGRKWHPLIHYSPLAASARNDAVSDKEDILERFTADFDPNDFYDVVNAVIDESGVPDDYVRGTRAAANRPLSASQMKLLLSYKLEFDRVRG
ncbi:MAG: hypothetical protein P8K76_00790 [Candidatus Binatia bacterium]|nr:hypothetical protein [Candidatus Binatia bacterium]MDG2008291.1 hypothetical protein [Candidatus Binatia bacterium]